MASSRSSLRNLCCTALGQVSIIAKVSPFNEYTEEEHEALIKTAKMAQATIMNMLVEIKNIEKEY